MGKRILVVDDERVVLGAVSRALRKTDCYIDTAQSADEAMKRIAGAVYDVVITDLMMPGADGLELMRRLRRRGGKARIIMLTGYPTIQTALKAKRLGAFEYVTKPFTGQELVSAVVRALRVGTEEHVPPDASVSLEQNESVYFIPEHSWARIETDGTVRIGMARSFASTLGEVVELELPAEGCLLEQGRMCVVVREEDGVEHNLHSPLSGHVLEINQTVVEHTDLALRDPEGAGWLLRLKPRDPEGEVENLVQARPAVQ